MHIIFEFSILFTEWLSHFSSNRGRWHFQSRKWRCSFCLMFYWWSILNRLRFLFGQDDVIDSIELFKRRHIRRIEVKREPRSISAHFFERSEWMNLLLSCCHEIRCLPIVAQDSFTTARQSFHLSTQADENEDVA